MKSCLKSGILFLTGGILYVLIELAFRGRSHWSMFLVGGGCFVLIGGLNNWYQWKMSIILQMVISSAMVTAVEFVAGVVLNIWLGWGVWDYSDMPFQVAGQICLPFTVIWFILALPAIILDDILRWRWFGERFPKYHFL